MTDTSVEKLNDKWFRLVGNPLSVILFKLAQLPFFATDRWTFFWKSIISLAFTILSWEIARQIIIHARKWHSDIKQTKRRIGFMIFWLAIEMLILHLILSTLLYSTGLAATYAYPFVQFWMANAGIGFLVFLLIGGIYEAMYFFSQYRLALQKAESLKKQQAQQRLDALKTRVNPHFLFNSLTSLSALIGEDAPKAERFVDELSKVYRYLLRAGRHSVSSLGEELEFVESYAFLLKNRFEEGAFEVKSGGNFPKGADKLPPNLTEEPDQTLSALTLQNALDYLVRTQNLPLNIKISAMENELEITCAHQPKTISFDAPDNDWRQLEAQGARLESGEGQLKITVPFTQKTTTA